MSQGQNWRDLLVLIRDLDPNGQIKFMTDLHCTRIQSANVRDYRYKDHWNYHYHCLWIKMISMEHRHSVNWMITQCQDLILIHSAQITWKSRTNNAHNNSVNGAHSAAEKITAQLTHHITSKLLIHRTKMK